MLLSERQGENRVRLSIVCRLSTPPRLPSGKYVCPVIYSVLDLLTNMPTKGTIY